jgi:ABC-2 type transport system permease protein
VNTWHVELLRLLRTRRLVAITALFLAFGVTGPFVTKYASWIFDNLSGGSGLTVIAAPPTPAASVLSYVHNATQLGLVGCATLAALALCLDARAGLAIYYRTRISGYAAHMLPRLAVTALACAAAYTTGFALAWYETVTLTGAPALSPTIATWALGTLLIVFAVTLTFAVSTLVRSPLATVGATVTVILLLPAVAQAGMVARYLPTTLGSLPVDLYRGSASVLPTIISTVLCGAALAALGVVRGRSRRFQR